MRRGDVYALNDPYHGGTHLPDVTVITPVFTDDGAEPGLAGAVGLLATPRLALDIDVAAGNSQVKAWHRHADCAVATLSTCDGIVFEVAWLPAEQWTTELSRITAVRRDLVELGDHLDGARLAVVTFGVPRSTIGPYTSSSIRSATSPSPPAGRP